MYPFLSPVPCFLFFLLPLFFLSLCVCTYNITKIRFSYFSNQKYNYNMSIFPIQQRDSEHGFWSNRILTTTDNIVLLVIVGNIKCPQNFPVIYSKHYIPWRKKWQLTPVLLPGKPHGQRSLAGQSPWGVKELERTQQTTVTTATTKIMCYYYYHYCCCYYTNTDVSIYALIADQHFTIW